MTQATSFADAPGQGADINRSVNVNFSSDVSGFTQGVNQATQAVQQLNNALGSAAHQASTLSKFAGTKLMHFAVGDFAALGTATGIASRFEHQMSTMAATATVTGASMTQMKAQLTGVFSQFPVWREQVVALATAINNMGVARPSDVGKLTGSYTKLGAATGEDATSLAASGITLAKQMGNLDATKIDKFNSSLVVLAKTAGVSAQSITDFASALAPFARAAGIGETQVLGISAAFQKAGADGQVAANAFNQLLSTITQLQQLGGDASKYSGFLGMSQQQFKAQTPLTSATQIFNRISQGGPSAQNFVQDLGGIRVIGAAQRVAQQGGLGSMIGTAQNAFGGPALDKASAAAMDGFTNSVTNLRNEFTEMATLIGGPLLTPLKELMVVADKLAAGFNSLLRLVSPIVPVVGAIAGAVAIPAALGLAHAAGAGMIGAGRSMFGQAAPWRQAMTHGQEVGAAIQGGMHPLQAMALNQTAQDAAAGNLSPGHRAAFMAGQQQATMGAAPGMGRIRQAARAGWNAAGTGVSWWVGGQNQMNLQSTQSARTRAQGRPGTVRGWLGARRAFRQFGFRSAQAGSSGLAAGARAMRRRMPISAGGIAARAGLTAVSTAGRIGAGAASLAEKGSQALFTPGVMVAATAATALFNVAMDKAAKANQRFADDISGINVGAQAYDKLLGTTSSNLATFSTAVNDAAANLGKFAEVPLKDSTKVTAEDTSAVGNKGYKLGDQTIADIVSASDPKNVQANLETYLAQIGVQNPDMKGDQGTAIRRDLLKTLGVDKASVVEAIMTDLAKQQGQPGGFAASLSPDTQAGLAAGMKGSGFSNVWTGITQGIQGATQKGGLKQQQAGLADTLRAFAEAGAGTKPGDMDQMDRMKRLEASLVSQYNLDPNQLWSALGGQGIKQGTASEYGTGQTNPKNFGLGWGTSPFTTAQQGYGVAPAAFAQTDEGKKLLAALHLTPEQLTTMVTTGMPLPTLPGTSADITNLAGMGPLGRAMSTLAPVQQANLKPNAGGIQQAAINASLSAAWGLTGGPGGGVAKPGQAQAQLLDVGSKTSGALSDVATAAAEAAANLEKIAQIVMTPGQANLATVQTAQANIAAGQGPNATEAQQAAAAQAPTDVAGAISNQIQIDRQKLQAVKAYETQATRTHDDYQTQVRYSDDAFNTQQQRATESYGRSVTRTNRDYGVQVQRAEKQNQLSRTRAYEDFGIQQGRATQQYELSVTRTVKAAHLETTRATEDYNKDRKRQQEDYQTETSRSNEAYQLGVARQEQDFHTQQLQASQDYNTSRARQIEDYHTQVKRATRDFNTSQARATADFNKQMNRQAEQAAQTVYDPWTRMQRKATSSAANLLRNLTRQNASMAKQIAELAQAKQLGVSEQTIQQMDLSNPANAQQLDALIKSLKRNPSMVGQINSQVSQRVDLTKSLTQTNDNLSYKNALDDFQTQQERAREDFAKSMQDGAEDLTKSLTRNYDDFRKETARAQAQETLSLARGAEDHRIQLQHSAEDFYKNMSREATDFDTEISRSAEDLKTTLANNAIDFNTQMTNSVDDFTKQMARSETDFETAQANAATDHATTLSDMKTDFQTTMSQAAHDHEVALSQMTDSYKTAQVRAGEDLQASFTEYTGGLNTTMTQMTAQATQYMQQYGGTATQAYLQSIIDSAEIAAAAVGIVLPPGLLGPSNAGAGDDSWKQHPGGPQAGYGSGSAGAGNPSGQPGGPQGQTPATGNASHSPSHATGGIFLSPQFASVSESGPEMLLPLNLTGEQFMAKMFASAVKDVAKDASLKAGHTGGQMSTMPVLSRAIADGLIKAGRQTGGKVSIGGPVGDWRSGGYGATQPSTGRMNLLPQDKAFYTQLSQAQTKQLMGVYDANGRMLTMTVTKGDLMLQKEITVLGKELSSGAAHNEAMLATVITKILAKEITMAMHQEASETRAVIQRTDASVSFAGAQIKVVASDANKMAKELAAKAKLAKLTSPVKH